MNDSNAAAPAGPARDFVGYGPEPPVFRWPGGALVAINLVINYEEGGEYSLGDNGVNDTRGEYSFQYGPEIRDLGTETHMEYGSRVGIWRLCRLLDRYGIASDLQRLRPGARAQSAAVRDGCGTASTT